MKNIIPLIGRVLLAAVFLVAGYGKIMQPGGTQQYIASHGMPLPVLSWAAAVVFELGGGMLLVLGYRARWAAGALIVFTILATAVFHSQLSDRMQMIMFMKNLAILGGLLMVISYGPGAWSLGGKR
ncbi:MAG: DoxX family protein [Deltaproteobacteria bacterium]|nr:DoxX family protein [Deltaproteobacteria bacterium]